MNQNPHRYDDMLNLPHHVSKNHPQMSIYNRAAQFSPFQALTGYEDSVNEAARFVDTQAELTEDQKLILDQKLQYIISHAKEPPLLTVVYFVPDALKNGGSYESLTGHYKGYHPIKRVIGIYTESETKVIHVNDISDIQIL